MNRRDFFRRAVGGTAVIVASHQCGWPAEIFKRLLAAVMRKPAIVRTATLTSVSSLAAGYRKHATKLYAAFKYQVEEFEWLDDYAVESGGREILIPV